MQIFMLLPPLSMTLRMLPKPIAQNERSQSFKVPWWLARLLRMLGMFFPWQR